HSVLWQSRRRCCYLTASRRVDPFNVMRGWTRCCQLRKLGLSAPKLRHIIWAIRDECECGLEVSYRASKITGALVRVPSTVVSQRRIVTAWINSYCGTEVRDGFLELAIVLKLRAASYQMSGEISPV